MRSLLFQIKMAVLQMSLKAKSEGNGTVKRCRGGMLIHHWWHETEENNPKQHLPFFKQDEPQAITQESEGTLQKQGALLDVVRELHDAHHSQSPELGT